MVEEAQARRAPAEQWVDRFAFYYTPAMMFFAVGVALLPPLLTGGHWGKWFYEALVILVIACPCALVISTPVAIVAGLTRAARAGVLIKGGVFLEAAARIRVVALDKTGTLTHGGRGAAHRSARQPHRTATPRHGRGAGGRERTSAGAGDPAPGQERRRVPREGRALPGGQG